MLINNNNRPQINSADTIQSEPTEAKALSRDEIAKNLDPILNGLPAKTKESIEKTIARTLDSIEGGITAANIKPLALSVIDKRITAIKSKIADSIPQAKTSSEDRLADLQKIRDKLREYKSSNDKPFPPLDSALPKNLPKIPFEPSTQDMMRLYAIKHVTAEETIKAINEILQAPTFNQPKLLDMINGLSNPAKKENLQNRLNALKTSIVSLLSSIPSLPSTVQANLKSASFEQLEAIIDKLNIREMHIAMEIVDLSITVANIKRFEYV